MASWCDVQPGGISGGELMLYHDGCKEEDLGPKQRRANVSTC